MKQYGFTCPFLIRLRDDPDRDIDKIWKIIETHRNKNPRIKQFLESDSYSMNILREMFVMNLMTMWNCAFIADRVAKAEAFTRKATRNKKAKIKKTLVQSFSKMSAKELLKFLQDANTDLQKSVELEEDDEARRQNILYPVLSIRSNHDDSRNRTVFMRMASRFMYQTTGEFHDKEVATLTNIAFPDKETLIDMVRSARRGIRS
jgi:hypothetical protein